MADSWTKNDSARFVVALVQFSIGFNCYAGKTKFIGIIWKMFVDRYRLALSVNDLQSNIGVCITVENKMF